MNTYFERSFALATQETRLVWPASSTRPLLTALSTLILLLLLQSAGLTLTQEVVLILHETLAFLGHHPAAVGA